MSFVSNIPLPLTFFGATYSYIQRGYDTLLSINSLPTEVFSEEELAEYSWCFNVLHEKLIIEILEYADDKKLKEQLLEMITYANAAASLVTQKKGAIKSMPNIAEIGERLTKDK